MYKEKLVFSLKCPKHKSFTPLNGEESIKGGCQLCHSICVTHGMVKSLETRIKITKEILEKGI